MGGHYFDGALRSLEVRETCTLKLNSSRMQASPQILSCFDPEGAPGLARVRHFFFNLRVFIED